MEIKPGRKGLIGTLRVYIWEEAIKCWRYSVSSVQFNDLHTKSQTKTNKFKKQQIKKKIKQYDTKLQKQ